MTEVADVLVKNVPVTFIGVQGSLGSCQSGYVEVCKTSYSGSIPLLPSRKVGDIMADLIELKEGEYIIAYTYRDYGDAISECEHSFSTVDDALDFKKRFEEQKKEDEKERRYQSYYVTFRVVRDIEL